MLWFCLAHEYIRCGKAQYQGSKAGVSAGGQHPDG